MILSSIHCKKDSAKWAVMKGLVEMAMSSKCVSGVIAAARAVLIQAEWMISTGVRPARKDMTIPTQLTHAVSKMMTAATDISTSGA